LFKRNKPVLQSFYFRAINHLAVRTFAIYFRTLTLIVIWKNHLNENNFASLLKKNDLPDSHDRIAILITIKKRLFEGNHGHQINH